MTNFRIIHLLLLPLIMLVASEASAQRFSVESFKALPNDVSAFINPVRDLNDEDCGLVKVIASEDFVFSTRLGVVKRVDKTGEIWLYIPRGSKKITVKHAEWGVLRDYVFSDKIDSHMTYEMRISEPVSPIKASMANTVVTTVRDTLVLTRVDTLVVVPEKKHVPFNIDVVATIGWGGKSMDVSGGVLLMALKRHGGFVHASSDFGKIGSVVGECGKNGEISGSIPFYTGHTRQSSFMINAGAAHRITDWLAIYEGAGYAETSLAWQLAPSEGGGYVKNSYYCRRGISFELGVVLAYKRIVLSASAMTIKGADWYGSVGVGFRLGK